MKTLTVEDLKNALLSASNKLSNNRDRIDALNIFPVPDGDTGTNMSSTFQRATEVFEKNKFETVKDLINDFSKNMLLTARGNSGVILSQIFRGFSNAWKSVKELSANDIVKGFKSASKTAYDSVLKPVEGTILTVIRETSEKVSEMNITASTSIAKIFDVAVEAAKKSLANTPNILPVLKDAGVVDSGGEGLVMVLEGIRSALNGKFVEIDLNSTRPLVIASNTEIYSGEFGYCTELIIKIDEPSKFVKSKFVKEMEKHGNSLVVVNDNDVLKIHIHAKAPWKVFKLGQAIGEFMTVKVENMTEQANNTKSNIEQKKTTEKKERKINAIISCNAGSGFVNLMREFETDYVIDGRNSNNPSTQDIIEAINEVDAKNIIILPNNSNVILAAQQASKIKSNEDVNIHIIPTKSQIEGITAIMNYSSELEMKDNLKEIKQGLKNLIVAGVTQAVKDAKMDDVKIKKGEYLMMMQHKIVGTKKTIVASAKAVIDKMIKSKKRKELLVIYCGEKYSKNDVEAIEKYVLSKYDVEVQVQEGGQTVYELLFGLE